ncbi:hypothetical protein BH23BAC3_BH23BAC3_32470 [soil metagenome]
MKKQILLLGAFDTKGKEFRYVRDLIEERGFRTLLLDTGILNDPTLDPEVPANRTAKAGGSSFEELRSKADRGAGVDVMIKGVQKLVPELYREGLFDAVLSLGVTTAREKLETSMNHI